MKSATDLLLERTYEEVWKRGEAYVNEGKILIASADDRGVRAVARGTKRYIVQLKFAGGGVSKSCTCPIGQRAEARHPPCKHMVAVAILWDEARGVPRPTPEEVGEATIPPPLITRAQVDAMYRDPLHADLEVLRMCSDEFNLSPRAHARLPNKPSFEENPATPLTLAEVREAFRTIAAWPRRSTYHSWFCAGEMAAAFCEVLRIVFRRLPASPPLVGAEILAEAQGFNQRLIIEMIDDSEGEHAFTEAHLDELCRLLKEQSVPADSRARFLEILRQYEEGRGNY